MSSGDKCSLTRLQSQQPGYLTVKQVFLGISIEIFTFFKKYFNFLFLCTSPFWSKNETILPLKFWILGYVLNVLLLDFKCPNCELFIFFIGNFFPPWFLGCICLYKEEEKKASRERNYCAFYLSHSSLGKLK